MIMLLTFISESTNWGLSQKGVSIKSKVSEGWRSEKKLPLSLLMWGGALNY